MDRRAKIVATLGPASSDEKTLSQLIASVDVFRLNLSHGNHDSHRQLIKDVRRLAAEKGRIVSILADLMGPRHRLGEVSDGPRQLSAGDQIYLGKSAADVDLPVEDSDFLDHLRPGERILIDNGLVEVAIRVKEADRVRVEVLHGGPVSTRKGINLPDTSLPFTISKKDWADIAFAVRERVDYLAVSFVGGPGDLEAIRAVVQGAGGVLPLVAKLERAAAMRHLEATIRAADAVMVARGDLGVEVPLHQVPVMQKKIIAAGKQQGKPVIVATQMLESMMEHPRPTRAEASDIANAVFDGADALMLSGETAAGRFPVAAVETMSRIIREAEDFDRPTRSDSLEQTLQPLLPGLSEQLQLRPDRDINLEIPDVVAAAAVYAACRLNVRQIVAFSQSGFTVRTIARYRPQPPILAITRDAQVAQRVQLVWGARPLLLDRDVTHHDEVVSVVDRLLLAAGLAQPGDTIIILMGDPIAERPLTNLMRVHRVRSG